ncbi:MAG: hypothetical protein ACLS4Y_05100 [Faecalibacterium sp.]
MKHIVLCGALAVLLAAALAEAAGQKTADLCPPGWQPGTEIDPAGFHARHRGDHRAVHP